MLSAEAALEVSAEHDGKVGLTLYLDRRLHVASLPPRSPQWQPVHGWVISRQEGRKLIRRLLDGIARAEALQHAAKLIREGHRS